MRTMSYLLAAVAVISSGCATAPQMGNVIPQSGGKYEVLGTGESREEALKSALFSAESTCKERKMRHVVSNQSTAYKGIVSEESNKTMGKAAEIIGMATGKWITTLSSEDDYQVKLNFSCEI